MTKYGIRSVSCVIYRSVDCFHISYFEATRLESREETPLLYACMLKRAEQGELTSHTCSHPSTMQDITRSPRIV